MQTFLDALPLARRNSWTVHAGGVGGFDGASPDVVSLSPFRSLSLRDLEGEVRRCQNWNKITGIPVFLGVAAVNLPGAIERLCRCSLDHRSGVDRLEVTLKSYHGVLK
jgi:hypothetical protein